MAKAHRAYRHTWWRRSKEITERDYQAMCNFADEGIPFDALSEHFGCSIAHVEEEIVLTERYGYRRRTSNNTSDWGAGPDALLSFQRVLRRLEQAPRAEEEEPDWDMVSDTVDWESYHKAVEQWEKKRKPREKVPHPVDFLPERMRERLMSRYVF